MKLYKVIFKNGEERFIRVEAELELLQQIDLSNVKTIELIFEGSEEDIHEVARYCLSELEDEFNMLSNFCKQSAMTISQAMDDPTFLLSIMNLLEDHIEKAKSIFEKFDVLVSG